MKRQLLFLLTLLLLTATISLAQVSITRKSIIQPEHSERYINPWSVGYAQNTRTGETLNIWFEWNCDPNGRSCTDSNVLLMGRIVDGQGKSISKPLTMISKHQNPTDVFNCCFSDKVTYNPITNEYLITYAEGYYTADSSFFKILAQRFAADGRPKGNAVDITSRFPERAPYDNKPIDVEFNPATEGYLHFSQRHSVPADSTTFRFYELLKSNAQPDGSPVMFNGLAPGDTTFFDSGKMLTSSLVADGTGGEYVITAIDGSNLNKLQNLQRQDFTAIGRLSAGLLGAGPIVELNSSDSAIAYFTDDTNVIGQAINSSGKLGGSSFTALNAPGKNSRLLISTVAFATTPKGVIGMLIALDDDGYPNGSVSVWAQALNANGKPVGPSKKIYATSPTERIETNKVFALPFQAGDKGAQFVWYGLKGDPHFLDTSYIIQKFDLTVRLP